MNVALLLIINIESMFTFCIFYSSYGMYNSKSMLDTPQLFHITTGARCVERKSVPKECLAKQTYVHHRS